VSNTSNTLVVDPPWTTVPDTTSRYAIRFVGVGVMSLSAWGGVALTGRDVTQDLQKLQNLDALLSSRASEATLAEARDKLTSIDGKVATESTLSSIDSKVGTQTSFNHGQVTVGTSAVQLPSAAAVKGVLVKAHKDNTGTVYVGKDSAVSTTNGFELAPGEAIEVDNANKIWLIADAADQKVSWIAV